MRIDPKSPNPIYAQLVALLKSAIAQGRYRPGDALPSVRALAAEHLINPNTVMRAYQLLEFAGLITTRRGKGIYLTPNAVALCRRELGHADLERLAELVARLRAQGVSAAEIQAAVKSALAAEGGEQNERHRLG